MKKFRRILSILLAAVLSFGILSVTASAAPKENYMEIEPEKLWEVMDDYRESSGFWGQKSLKRNWINRIEFLDSIPANAHRNFDFSRTKDKSIIGWYTPNTLHVAADGKIVLGANCSGMFAYFPNLTEIEFNGCVDTSQVENMSYMFYGCSKLQSVDVSNFDTSRVTNMASMFACCEQLKVLDVSSFKTGKVTDLSLMFYQCKSVEKLDVSGFDTSSSTYLNGMFCDCEKLTELDVSKFNTSNVIGMCHTFRGCGAQDKLDLSGFDTSKVQGFTGFMDKGRTINGQPWEKLFKK